MRTVGIGHRMTVVSLQGESDIAAIPYTYAFSCGVAGIRPCQRHLRVNWICDGLPVGAPVTPSQRRVCEMFTLASRQSSLAEKAIR
jgi:hypothetical protein